MSHKNIIQIKSYQFAIRIVKLHLHLIIEKWQYDLGRQILRSGTSIGANTEEAIGAESKADFVHKFSIAYKEARETKFWLCLLRDTDVIDNSLAESMISDCEEIIRIIGKIKQTSWENSNRN